MLSKTVIFLYLLMDRDAYSDPSGREQHGGRYRTGVPTDAEHPKLVVREDATYFIPPAARETFCGQGCNHGHVAGSEPARSWPQCLARPIIRPPRIVVFQILRIKTPSFWLRRRYPCA